MFVNTTSFANTATAVVGAVAMSAACLMVAVSPARAETATSARASIERSIDANLRTPPSLRGENAGIVTLSVSVAADGSVSDVSVMKSSGFRSFDREAVRTARAVAYPAGQDRTIAMVLGFNREVPDVAKAQASRLLAAYRSDPRHLLAQNVTHPAG